MYSLVPPTRTGLEDFDNILSRRRVEARELLKRNRTLIADAYDEYLTRSGNSALLCPINITNDCAEALKANFDFLDSGRSHDFLRDEILGSALLDACPYCNATPVDSLDHALPRAVYPEFSILAQNLVPACVTCNRKKGDDCFQKTGLNLMHPYFVQIPDDPILFTAVAVGAREVTWEFYLQQNGGIDDDQFESIKNLFNVLDLAERYSQASVGAISDITGYLDDLQRAGGMTETKRFLHELGDSARRRRGENYWKTAILRALAASDDFCDGGHKLLS